MKRFNIHSIIARIISAARDFAESGPQNIIRVSMAVLIGLALSVILTFSTHGDIRLLHIFDTLFLKFKLWLPLLFGCGAYVIFGLMMRVNSESMEERFWNTTKDENGVRFAKNGTYGTARWLTKKEAREKLEVAPIQTCNGVILGSFDEKNREVVCIPRGTKQIREITNQNVCILGSPGEGKSWGYVRSNMLQAIRRGESVIVTDPKGELFTDMSALFRQNGYEVKVFNLANPQKSDAWNAMDVCFNKVTGNVDLNRVKIFVEAIMKNTSEAGEMNDYFAKNERTLYEAVIMYMAEKYTKEIRYVLEEKIVRFCDTNDQNETYYRFRLKYVRPDAYINDIKAEAKEIFIKYGPTPELCEIVANSIKGAKAGVYEEPAKTQEERAAQFDRFFDILTKQIVKPTLSNVYHKINKLDVAAFKGEVDSLDNPTALCHIPLSTILQQSENVWGNFTNGCSVRLNVLNDETLRLLVSEDDIDLSAPGRKKCAYFCIFPDQDFTFQFVSSLFFTFLFKDQIETADANGGNPVAINYILDEFCNIGMVPDFSNKISTARSRNIGITMIVQSITQLYDVYTENITNTILGCCSTTICLGVNDEKSIEYITKQLGETTILQNSTRKERQVGRIESVFSPYNESVGEGSRNLMYYDELRSIDPYYQIIICSHLKPMRLRKVVASAHPLSNNGNFEKTSISDIRPFIDRYPGCEQRDEFARAQYSKIIADKKLFNDQLAAIAEALGNQGEMSEVKAPSEKKADTTQAPAEMEQLEIAGVCENATDVPMGTGKSQTAYSATPRGGGRATDDDRSITAILGGTSHKDTQKKGVAVNKDAKKENPAQAKEKGSPANVSETPKDLPATKGQEKQMAAKPQSEVTAPAHKNKPNEAPVQQKKPQEQPQPAPKEEAKMRNFAKASVRGKAAPIEKAGGRSELRAIPVTEAHRTSEKEVALLVAAEMAAQQARKAAQATKDRAVATQGCDMAKDAADSRGDDARATPVVKEKPTAKNIQSLPVIPVEKPSVTSEAVEFIPNEPPAPLEFIPVQEEPLQTFEIADFT